MTIISYLLRTVLISGSLYGFYVVFQRNKPFHRYNRFFLLAIPLVALLLPFLKIPLPAMYQTGDNSTTGLLSVLTVRSWEQEEAPGSLAALNGSPVNWQSAGWILYGLVFLVLLTIFFRSVMRIRRLAKKYQPELINGVLFFQTEEPGTPFSFFRQIFWDRKLDVSSRTGRQIFRHELSHVTQKHSIDSLYLEILRILCWFNPFFHLIRKESKAVHEFLADANAATESDKHEYAEMLVWQTILKDNRKIAHPFFNSHLKRRVRMITLSGFPRSTRRVRLLILPLFLVLVYGFNAGFRQKMRVPAAHNPAERLTVVIDAGHGGSDDGFDAVNGIKEKDIALDIAKKIKELSKDYPIQVLMTRESDELPGHAKNLRDGLRYRTEFANSNKADLFISIHVNADPTGSMDGFDMFISKRNERFIQASAQLGSIITSEIKKTYKIADTVKQRGISGIWVLDKSEMPSVLIECGYLTNKKDREFIADTDNQEKIARDILLGILEYQAKEEGTKN